MNESGDAGALLRQRQMRQLMGFTVGFSAGVKSHTKGTENGAYVTNGTFVSGDTTVGIDTGAGTVVAGDVVTFAGDTHKYVVGTALAGGNIILNKPGLRAALGDGVAVTVGANYTANMAFVESAIVLAARLPAMPKGGDAADDVMVVTDPVSGLSFQVASYRQYRRQKIEIGLAWGVASVKSEHMALLLG